MEDSDRDEPEEDEEEGAKQWSEIQHFFPLYGTISVAAAATEQCI
jgi:hypothetical protein